MTEKRGTYSKPEGAPPTGMVVVQTIVGVIGKVKTYHPPGTYFPPGGGAAIDEWCVELDSGDVLLWRAESFSVLNPSEFELLGGAAAGAEALFKGIFMRAKVSGIGFARAVELTAIAIRAQLAGIERTMKGQEPDAPVTPTAPAPPSAEAP